MKKIYVIYIYADRCSSDSHIVTYKIFKNLCTHIWNEKPYNFVTIDSTRQLHTGKYRKNFDEFWIPPHSLQSTPVTKKRKIVK